MAVISRIAFIQIFDWESEDKKHKITFQVTDMLRAIVSGKLKAELVTSPIDANFAEQWCKLRIDNHYYCKNMAQKKMDEPVLGVWMDDNTVLLIDGSHRYMARYYAGYATVDYMLVAYGDWQGYAKETKL